MAQAVMAELSRRQEMERLRFVHLNPANKRYADAWVDPNARIIVYAAANGLGKTYQTVTFLGWSMWPETAPEWFRSSVTAKLRGWPKSFRLASTKKEVEEVGSIHAAIKHLWPKGRYSGQKAGKQYESVFLTDTGWMGDVMSYDQDLEQYEGGDRAIVVFNEPPPEPIYKASVSRTRKGGMLVFPGTPLLGAAWLKDKIVDAMTPETRLVSGDIEEACIEHSVNGHLHHNNIEFMVSQYDPDEREARAKGAFMHLSGRIWKGFNRETFVAKEPIKPDPKLPKFMVVDPAGRNKPFAVIWGQVTKRHGLQVIREWPDGSVGHLFEQMKDLGYDVPKYVQVFKGVESDLGTIATRIIDRRFSDVRDIRFGKSLKDWFRDEGFVFIDSYGVPGQEPEIETGIQAFKNYLKVDALTGEPMLQVSPVCVNFMRALERWARDPESQKPNDDVWKNFADVGRYMAAANLSYSEPIPDAEWNNVKTPGWA